MLIIKNLIWNILGFLYLIFKKRDKRKWIICYGGIGDVCYNMAYSKWILNNIDNSVYYIDNKHKNMIKRCYDISETSVVYYNSSSFFSSCIIHIGGGSAISYLMSRIGIFKLYPYIYYPISKYVPCSYLSFVRSYLNIPNNVAITYPKVEKTTIKCISDFDYIKNKVIVLNPYSNSMGSGILSLWEDLVDFLCSNGYIIYTNVIGDQKPIKNTSPLNCTLDEIYTISSQIPLVISIRSGIIDYCISSGGVFYIVYFNEKSLPEEVGRSMKTIYGLDDWGKGKVHEIIYDKECVVLSDFKKFAKENGIR